MRGARSKENPPGTTGGRGWEVSDVTTEAYQNAEAIANHYRPGVRPEGGWFKIPCPAHRGDDDNLHLADAPDGGLILRCWSAACTFNDVITAFASDGMAVKRQWTYPNGKVVTRLDRPGAPKDIKSPGSTRGVPLLISNDSPDALVAICEGESDRDAVLSAGLPDVAAACFVGGAKMSGEADYGAVKGRRVAIWPDHDNEGATALLAAAQACKQAGAANVYAVPYVGAPDSKQGAADLTPDMVAVFLGKLREWEDEHQTRIDWQWRNVGDFASEPAPVHTVSGLLIEGGITLWWAPVKTGKSTALMAMLKALSPGGPTFCGMNLDPTPTLLFTEEPPAVMGERVRQFDIPVAGGHFANSASAMVLSPDDFAEEVYRAYQDHGGSFGLVAVDTLSAFINCGDWNDYAATGSALSPIRQLARSLPGASFLLFHHQNKTGGDGWGGALGSTALTASADQLVRMGSKDGKRTITVGGRYGTGPFPYGEPVSLSITPEGVEILGTASDMAGDLLVEHLGDDPTTVKDMLSAMGADAPGRKAVDLALHQLIDEGKAVQVEEGKGNRPATYRRKNG